MRGLQLLCNVWMDSRHGTLVELSALQGQMVLEASGAHGMQSIRCGGISGYSIGSPSITPSVHSRMGGHGAQHHESIKLSDPLQFDLYISVTLNSLLFRFM